MKAIEYGLVCALIAVMLVAAFTMQANW